MNYLYSCFFWATVWLLPLRTNAQTSLLPSSLANAPDTLKLWTLREIGDSLVNAGQLSLAKQAYQQSLDLAQTTGNHGSIGLGYRGVGYWYQQVSDFPRAIALFERALTEFKMENNPYHIARTMHFIGFAYDQVHNDPQAFRYALAGLKVAQQNNLDKLVALFNGQLAQLENHRKNYSQSDAYTQKVLAYYQQKKDWLEYYTTLYNSALLDKERGLYVRSEQKFRQTERYSLTKKDNYLLGYVQAGIPYALIPQNKLDEAERYCQQALSWVKKMGVNKFGLLADVNGHLGQIAEKRGDYKQALSFYKRQKASQDSVFNETKNRQLAELETRYQTKEKEDQIQKLADVNTLQHRQLWAGGGGLLVLTLLLFTLYGLYKRVQKSRRKIQQQADQLALMMKELHHRVKNNLAIVSSLLKLQSSRLDDEQAIAAVRTGQQRVEAMSLIHQRLYQTDQITRVNMREYLTDLAEGLMQAYGYQPRTFDLQLDIDTQELDVDVAMPLGLIANELITNAFKYAYAGNQRPGLRISLHTNSDAAANVDGRSGITLEVQDNGPGIEAADWQRLGTRASFGKRLIVSLSEQLDGQFDLFKQDGTLFRLYIPQDRLVIAA